MNPTVLAAVLAALISAIAVLAAQWLTYVLMARQRRAERLEVRRAAWLTQRAADLRDLGGTLTDMLTAAEEVIWARVSSDKLMPRSDPRAMRVTDLGKRSRLLRLLIGDDQLIDLARKAARAADLLSDSNQDEMEEHRQHANQALRAAIDRIAALIREADPAP